MAEPTRTVPETSDFSPTSTDVADVLAWFANFDALATAKDVEGMADQARPNS